MAEGDFAVSEVPVPGAKNGKLDLHKISTQFAQFMDVDTAKEVSFIFHEMVLKHMDTTIYLYYVLACGRMGSTDIYTQTSVII